MDRDRSVMEGASDCGAEVREGAAPRSSHIGPAPLVKVMIEQLQYLASHQDRSCGPACPDCVRFEQVQGWLLTPFRSRGRRGYSRRAA